jgi:ADP-heptose:LPS heptosyltransferase
MLESKTIFEKVLEDKDQVLRLNYNRLLESAQVGDRPFDKKFYQEAYLPHAIDQATNIVIIMGDHLGDATLSLSLITSLDRYFKLNSLESKKMTMISPHRDLFESLRTIYPELDLLDKVESFNSHQDDKLFCFNLNRKFHDYQILGMEEIDEQDPTKVFRHDCQDWIKEEIPIKSGVIKKYDLLPLRIMRNMEILFGQKLYEDIYKIREFIPKENSFDEQKEKLIEKFNLDRNKPLITISPGSSAQGKEYTPECWVSIINIICERKPDIQIFFIDDTNEEKRVINGDMIDHLKREKSYVIHRGSIALNEMNTLMHMTCVSVTPDTGIGHYSSMCGTPNVMFSLSNAVFWSGPNTFRVTHPYGRTMIRNHALVDLSFKDSENSFYYGESENKRGASDIPPERVAERVLQIIQHGD